MASTKLFMRDKLAPLYLLLRRNLSLISVNEEVRQALSERKAVVALESTIITHGMKFPDNFDTAITVQNVIREQGAVPATIAVVKGQIKVGLTVEELEELSCNQNSHIKISRRDYPYAISKKLTGGTTVSGTMLIAHKVGISIFVTGGVGGVHRGGETTMDISADLTELGKTPVAVISSGIKSILDIEKTLEYLETQGVAVATFGPSREFPAFYTRRSNFESPCHLASEVEAAEFIQTIFDMELNSGILIGVPIPEEYSMNETDIQRAIDEGLRKAQENRIKGKAVTPYLLSEISDISQGKSLEANIALIKNNALVGGKIAVEHAKLRRNNVAGPKATNTKSFNPWENSENAKVVVIGAANLDFVVKIEEGGFRPKAVFFTCIDSRMIPTRFTDTCVGDMFVVRNAGNIIPHSRFYPDEITTNEPAALELGCVVNDIRHIIVCGHSDCKAMNLLHSLRDKEFGNVTNKRISPLRAWMCAHATSSLERFLEMEEKGPSHPLVFHAETPFNKFVAYIDPENKFKTEDKLSQMDGRTIKGRINQGGGGVGRNIADALGKLKLNPFLITAVGNEEFGDFVTKKTIPHLDLKGIIRMSESGTGTCMVLCDQTGECLLVVGDMDIHGKITIDHVKQHAEKLIQSSLVVLDGNLRQDTLDFVLTLCQENSVPVWYEPTDIFKADRPFLNRVPPPKFISPNYQEFVKIYETIYPEEKEINYKSENIIENCIQKGIKLTDFVDNIIITLGKNGVLIIRRGGNHPFFANHKYIQSDGQVSHRLYKPEILAQTEVVNVSGAGDCFASGFIAAMLQGHDEINCVRLGFKCSLACLKCDKPVPSSFF